MRARLIASALVAGTAFLALPAAPAQAYCDAAIYALTGKCANGCTIAASAYRTADSTARDALPDVQFICFA